MFWSNLLQQLCCLEQCKMTLLEKPSANFFRKKKICWPNTVCFTARWIFFSHACSEDFKTHGKIYAQINFHSKKIEKKVFGFFSESSLQSLRQCNPTCLTIHIASMMWIQWPWVFHLYIVELCTDDPCTGTKSSLPSQQYKSNRPVAWAANRCVSIWIFFSGNDLPSFMSSSGHFTVTKRCKRSLQFWGSWNSIVFVWCCPTVHCCPNDCDGRSNDCDKLCPESISQGGSFVDILRVP